MSNFRFGSCFIDFKILNNIGNKIVNVCSILTSFVLPILTANCFVMAESSIIPLFLSTLVVIHSKLNMVSYNHKLLMGKCILHLNSIRKLLAFWWTHKWCINFVLENSESVEMLFTLFFVTDNKAV